MNVSLLYQYDVALQLPQIDASYRHQVMLRGAKWSEEGYMQLFSYACILRIYPDERKNPSTQRPHLFTCSLDQRMHVEMTTEELQDPIYIFTLVLHGVRLCEVWKYMRSMEPKCSALQLAVEKG